MSDDGAFLPSLPVSRPTPCGPRRPPREPAEVVSDSEALTPYMSHVEPGWPPCVTRATDVLLTSIGSPVSVVRAFGEPPGASQPLWAPRFATDVAPIVSATDTNARSAPRRSFSSTYSMHAMPPPAGLPLSSLSPRVGSFQRSGRT